MNPIPSNYRFTFILLAAIFLVSSPADAKKRKKGLFSVREAADYEEKMRQQHNPYDSGAGLVKVEIEMVKYYAGVKKDAKKDGKRNSPRFSKRQQKKAKKNAKKNIVSRLQRIAEIQRLRAATTFRGLWEITVSPGSGNSTKYFLHFSDVNETTDEVAGTIENPADNPLEIFVGHERLNAVFISSYLNNGGTTQYYLFINGDTLYGSVQTTNGSPLTVNGTRLRGP